MTSVAQTSSEKDEAPQKDQDGDPNALRPPLEEPTKKSGEEGDKSQIEVEIEGNENKVFSSTRDMFNINAPIVNIIAGEDPKQSQPPKRSNTLDDNNMHLWFENLDAYGKYYAVAVCFYHRLKVADFLTVLPIIRNHLIRTGDIEKKTDAPLRHLEVKTNEIKDPTRRAIVIQFPSEKTAEKILTLLIQEYSPILFNFVSILDDVVRNNPRNWELRWRSAAALGQISELDVDHVYETVISNWMTDDKAYVRATVGYYFFYILDEDNAVSSETQDYLSAELKKLANPKKFNYKLWERSWAAVATCEKIGLLKSSQINNIATSYLEGLAGINHLRVADSVIHALVEWSVKENFTQAMALLIAWIEGGSAGDRDEDNPFQVRCMVALLAFRAVVEVNYDLLDDDNKQDVVVPVEVLKVISQDQAGDVNLWQGMISIGVRYFDFRMGGFFFDMLESWTESISDKEFLIEFISSWLKEVFFNLRSKTHLENRLKNVWAKSKNKTLQTIAKKTQEKIKKGT